MRTNFLKALSIASLACASLAPAEAPAQQAAGLKPSLQVTSPTYSEFAFLAQRHASDKFNCGGQNLSPALAWQGEPGTTQSFAVIYYDPDGSNGQGEGHWLGYNIPPAIHALPEGAMSGTTPGITVGLDDHGLQEYYGACPPYGKFHHYIYGVYALDLPVGTLAPGMKRADLLKAIYRHVVAYQSIVFVYQRKPPPGGPTRDVKNWGAQRASNAPTTP